GAPLELVRVRQQGPWPLGLVGPNLEPLPIDDALFSTRRDRDAAGHDELVVEYRGPAGGARKALRVLDSGLMGLEGDAAARGWGLVLGPGIRNPTAKELDSKRQPRQVVFRAAEKVETVLAARAEEQSEAPTKDLTWVGVEDNYFLSLLVPQSPLAGVTVQPVA